MDEAEDPKRRRLCCLEQNCSFRFVWLMQKESVRDSRFLILSRGRTDDPGEQAGEMALIAKAQIGGDLRDRLTGRQLGLGGIDTQLQLITMGRQTDFGPKRRFRWLGLMPTRALSSCSASG